MHKGNELLLSSRDILVFVNKKVLDICQPPTNSAAGTPPVRHFSDHGRKVEKLIALETFRNGAERAT